MSKTKKEKKDMKHKFILPCKYGVLIVDFDEDTKEGKINYKQTISEDARVENT